MEDDVLLLAAVNQDHLFNEVRTRCNPRPCFQAHWWDL